MKGPRGAHCAWLVACCLVMAGARAAYAEVVEPDAETPSAPARGGVPSVEVTVVGDFPNADAAGARVASWFESQRIPTHTGRSAELSASSVLTPSGAAGVRLWLVLRAPNAARLFFAVQERAEALPRFLVQEVELSGGVDELGLERLAQVAYLSAVALWQGDAENTRQDVERALGVMAPKPGAARARPVAKAAQAVNATALPTKPSQDGWHGRPQWTFDTSFRGEGGVFIGGGWDGGVAWRKGRSELTLLSRLRWTIVPYELEKDGITLDVSAITFGAQLGAARRLTDDWWLHAQLGPALEVVTVRAHSSSNPALHESPGAGSSYQPKLFGSLGLWVDLGPLKYSFAANLELPLVRKSYDVADGAVRNSRQALFVPWAVHPGVSVGFFL